jgi:hypothetical protein
LRRRPGPDWRRRRLERRRWHGRDLGLTDHDRADHDPRRPRPPPAAPARVRPRARAPRTRREPPRPAPTAPPPRAPPALTRPRPRTTSTTDTSTTDASTTGAGSELTLEHIQVKGTHNSYHLKPLIPFDKSHDYSHAPLDEQLESQGVRAFELDVHKGLGGLEVYHITVIDAVSTCDTFGGCLGVIKGWSDAHPQHLPITVWIEIKDQTGGSAIGAGDLDGLDDVVRGVFPADKLLTPDDIQGDHPSVRDALAADGWPLIDSVRGQVLFVLLNVEDTHASNYTANYTTLAGRAMFARATPQQFASALGRDRQARGRRRRRHHRRPRRPPPDRHQRLRRR